MPDSPSAPSLDFANWAWIYRSGTFSPSGLIDLLLDRIETAPDPAIWISRLTAEEVRSQVKAVEKRCAVGEDLPLYGVPFAVKDNIDIAGQPTTAGCPSFSYVPRSSASVVDRLAEAGAILIGKTNLDQFATGLAGDRTPYGTCRNPFAPEYISGGSSSGSAVAVVRRVG